MKMKVAYPTLGIKTLCQLFGKTWHAYYDALQRSRREELKDDLILGMEITRPRPGTPERRSLEQKMEELLQTNY
jgi:putative transposase